MPVLTSTFIFFCNAIGHPSVALFDLWVIPLGRVCRNALSVCIKGSEYLQVSPHALDSLTVEQPYTLTDLVGAYLKVWESVRRSQFSRQRGHNVDVSLHEDLQIESMMTQRLTAQYHNLCALVQTELRTELCREQLWEYLNYFSFKSSLKISTVVLGAGLQLRCFYILILLFQISMLKTQKYHRILQN